MDELKKYLKPITIPFTLGTILLAWYKVSSEPFEKLLILFILVTVLIPFTIQIFGMLVTYNVPTVKSNNKSVKSSNKSHATNINISKDTKGNTKRDTKKDVKEQPKYKGGKINPSPLYPSLKESITSCSKNKLFSRDDVLTLKSEIDYRLGTHKFVYDKFDFQNDMHEIYIKIKSSKLGDSDFQYLLDVVNGIIIKNTKGGNLA